MVDGGIAKAEKIGAERGAALPCRTRCKRGAVVGVTGAHQRPLASAPPPVGWMPPALARPLMRD